MLRDVDEMIPKALESLKKVIEDPQAKRSEVLNSADKIIKYRFMFLESIRKEATDKLDLEMKQLSLEEKRIRVERLKNGGDPDQSSGEGNLLQNRSVPFQPASSDTFKDAELMHTAVS